MDFYASRFTTSAPNRQRALRTCVLVKEVWRIARAIRRGHTQSWQGRRRITVAVKPEDIQEGDEASPEQHPIAIALRRQRGVDDARVSKREVLIRRGEQWFRYGAPKRAS